jgi:hypothetical protein
MSRELAGKNVCSASHCIGFVCDTFGVRVKMNDRLASLFATGVECFKPKVFGVRTTGVGQISSSALKEGVRKCLLF